MIENAFGEEAARYIDTFYHLTGDDLLRHLFSVAIGLDSLVVGETQILAQVKKALSDARSLGLDSPELSIAFETAVRAGKTAREETPISRFPLSVSSIAVRLSEQIFGQIENCSILIVGVGEMGELTLRILREKGAHKITAVSRDRERAAVLAEEYHARAVGFDRIGEVLTETDIVITQTGSHRPVFTEEFLSCVMEERNFRDLFIIDIAFPRDVEDTVSNIPNLYLYNLDDLELIAEKNTLNRRQAAKQCERIIERYLKLYYERESDRELSGVISALQHYKNSIHRDILNSFSDSGHSPTEKFELASEQMLNRLLHPIILAMKESHSSGQSLETLLLKHIPDQDPRK